MQNLSKMINWLKKALGGKSDKFNSKLYWENRYRSNGNSGAGSYGQLAQFKADIINNFVEKNNIETVLEIGSGDGNQLKLLNYKSYIGLDVSKTAVELTKKIFKKDKTKKFYLVDDFDKLNSSVDLTLSIDVIYHLVEDAVFENYLEDLFALSNKYVIIYSSNEDKIIAEHVKSRKFTDWIDVRYSKSWRLFDVIENKYPYDGKDETNTSISSFFFYENIN